MKLRANRNFHFKGSKVRITACQDEGSEGQEFQHCSQSEELKNGGCFSRKQSFNAYLSGENCSLFLSASSFCYVLSLILLANLNTLLARYRALLKSASSTFPSGLHAVTPS